jgi:hypothetical protein
MSASNALELVVFSSVLSSVLEELLALNEKSTWHGTIIKESTPTLVHRIPLAHCSDARDVTYLGGGSVELPSVASSLFRIVGS